MWRASGSYCKLIAIKSTRLSSLALSGEEGGGHLVTETAKWRDYFKAYLSRARVSCDFSGSLSASRGVTAFFFTFESIEIGGVTGTGQFFFRES